MTLFLIVITPIIYLLWEAYSMDKNNFYDEEVLDNDIREKLERSSEQD